MDWRRLEIPVIERTRVIRVFSVRNLAADKFSVTNKFVDNMHVSPLPRSVVASGKRSLSPVLETILPVEAVQLCVLAERSVSSILPSVSNSTKTVVNLSTPRSWERVETVAQAHDSYDCNIGCGSDQSPRIESVKLPMRCSGKNFGRLKNRNADFSSQTKFGVNLFAHLLAADDNVSSVRCNKKLSSKLVSPFWTVEREPVSVMYHSVIDIQSQIPWNKFKDNYDFFIELYNVYVSSGVYGIRVAIHAHHFAQNYLPPAAPTPVCVDGMPSDGEGVPKWSLSVLRISLLFSRLISVSGLNAAMVMTSKGALSLFHAYASSHYASLGGRPKSAHTILESCVRWIVADGHACIFGRIIIQSAYQSSNYLQHSLLSIWCNAVSVDTKLDVCEQIRQLKRFFAGISYEYSSSYGVFFPRLNELFLSILCELYNVIITVFDDILALIRTYKPVRDDYKKVGRVILYKVDEDEYFGVFDIDKFVKDK
jgi:hypothetical protein